MPNKKKSRSQPSKKVAKAKIIRTPKKTGPGRPPKVFIAKPKAKQAGPGRPKKTIKTYMLPEKKNFRGFIVSNILHAPRKDNIILLLFVLSLLIFLFSIYVTILKSQNVLDEKMYLDESTVVNVQTGNIPFSQQEVSTGAATPTTQEVVDTKAVITAFYDAFNQKDIQTLYALTDSHLNKTNTFITYFTVNRISRFLGGVDGGVKVSDIHMSIVPANSTEVQEMKYTVSYTLKSGETFNEDRSALVIKKGASYKIGKLMCETTGCSKMPFFNPEKYGIK